MFTFVALITGIMVLAALTSPLDAAEEARQSTLVSAEFGASWLQSH